MSIGTCTARGSTQFILFERLSWDSAQVRRALDSLLRGAGYEQFILLDELVRIRGVTGLINGDHVYSVSLSNIQGKLTLDMALLS